MTVEAQTACRLLVYTTEDDRVGHRPVSEVLVERARQQGLRGATVWRGIEGFRSGGELRTTRFPDTARGLPLVVEIVDRPAQVEAFLAVVAELAPGSLATTEPVRVAGR